MAAPEQYGFAQSDCRTDIFALGKIIKTLFPNDAGMIPVIRKATKIDPDQRYSSIRELRRDLARTGKAPVWLGENGFKIVAIAIAAAAVILFAVATIKLFRIADRMTGESSVVYIREGTDTAVFSESAEITESLPAESSSGTVTGITTDMSMVTSSGGGVSIETPATTSTAATTETPATTGTSRSSQTEAPPPPTNETPPPETTPETTPETIPETTPETTLETTPATTSETTAETRNTGSRDEIISVIE